jgi:hypothetical protein
MNVNLTRISVKDLLERTEELIIFSVHKDLRAQVRIPTGLL